MKKTVTGKRAHKRRKPSVAPESSAGRELAAARWQGHTSEPTQPRRLKLSTIDRVKRHADRIGSTFDGALIDLLDRAKTP